MQKLFVSEERLLHDKQLYTWVSEMYIIKTKIIFEFIIISKVSVCSFMIQNYILGETKMK